MCVVNSVQSHVNHHERECTHVQPGYYLLYDIKDDVISAPVHRPSLPLHLTPVLHTRRTSTQVSTPSDPSVKCAQLQPHPLKSLFFFTGTLFV